jgi:hypothetical protein
MVLFDAALVLVAVTAGPAYMWWLTNPHRPRVTTTAPPEPPAPRASLDGTTVRVNMRDFATPGVTMDPSWRPTPTTKAPTELIPNPLGEIGPPPITNPTSSRLHCPGCRCTTTQ